MSLNLKTMLFKVNVDSNLFMKKIILYFSKKNSASLFVDFYSNLTLYSFIIYFSLFIY